ncbi:hypothetical protein L3556_09265 [Candidatus Synechococcus calcipolaris G9]|uniref:Uncharacterized protein n=1 Tax=Candidatus Synechococcus calcipolaris G9 TaxID=1497997 RepID=A0ABT6EZS8_9SYNE|nr:hypothetical protein [Candidatus Synechococcus calcipolaris]MDG2991113.1 hypothetical protein [Candidatus Synechococcus calcipolaris G9]
MGESATTSELGQVLDAIASMQSDIKSLQGHIQAMDKKLEIYIATTAEKFNTIEAKIDAVRVEVKTTNEQITDLSKRQTSTDNRLWAFLVALFFTMAGLLAKVTLFDKV